MVGESEESPGGAGAPAQSTGGERSAWDDVVTELEREQRRGTDPSSDKVQELVRRWDALAEALTFDDPGVRDSLERLSGKSPRAPNLSAELTEYLEQAKSEPG